MVKKLNGNTTSFDLSDHLLDGQYAILVVTGAASTVTFEFNHAGEVDGSGVPVFHSYPNFQNSGGGVILFEFATFTTTMRVSIASAQPGTPWYVTLKPLSMPEF